MELQELGGGRALVPSKNFYPSAFEAQSSRSSSYLISDPPSSLSPDPLSPYISLSSTIACANTQISLGCHFANGYYSCKLPPSTAFQQRVRNHHGVNLKVSGHFIDKQGVVSFGRTAAHCGEPPTRVRDVNMYQSFTGSYNKFPGYTDIYAAQKGSTIDHKPENTFEVEDYQSWGWSSNWNNQMCCSKEQNTHIWKSALTEETTTSRPGDASVYIRRGRKKRIPYTKLQLKELEHEYTITKFITKEKRRRIAFSTNLSERQVTIWFQNRRVKDKKISSKNYKSFESYI